MTCRDSGVECIVVVETKLGAGEVNGDYVRMDADELVGSAGRFPRVNLGNGFLFGGGLGAVVVCVCLLAAAVPLIIFVAPWITKQVVIPILNWEIATFSRPVLCLLLFASMALFPILLSPTAPSMWLAGITFGYGYGFLLLVGRLLLSLADATNTGSFLSVPQIVYEVIGFCIAATASAAIAIYAERTLQTLQLEDELS